MELPAVTTTATRAYISHHSEVMGESVRNYSMLYDTEYKIALWTAYHISAASFGPTTRTDNWSYDPKVPTDLQPKLARGWGESGVDRGHILPSGSRTANYVSNAATFFYTNMTAQNSDLNQGVWGKLEEKVRDYSSACDTLYVVTGAVLKTSAQGEISFVKDNDGKEVAKPQAYYKVLLSYDKETESYKSIAFWYENRKYDNAEPVAADTKSVAWVEEQTGFKFFDNLPEGIKSAVKGACVPADWGL
jgi:endonuclease G